MKIFFFANYCRWRFWRRPKSAKVNWGKKGQRHKKKIGNKKFCWTSFQVLFGKICRKIHNWLFCKEKSYEWATRYFFFLKNGPTPASFWFILVFFKQTIQFLTTNKCLKNVHPVSGARIWTYEYIPLTTRPGLPPLAIFLKQLFRFIKYEYISNQWSFFINTLQ